jgi:hypothetical protein
MTSKVNADNTLGGVILSGDSSGVLELQAGGTAVLTLNTTQAVGVGSTPDYGTSGQYLTSGGSSAAPTWTTLTVPPAAAQGFVTQFTGGNTPPTQAIDGFALI